MEVAMFLVVEVQCYLLLCAELVHTGQRGNVTLGGVEVSTLTCNHRSIGTLGTLEARRCSTAVFTNAFGPTSRTYDHREIGRTKRQTPTCDSSL